jgi:hypothetical protein
MFIETAASVQELSAAIERIADAVGPFILVFVHTKERGGGRCEVFDCTGKVSSGGFLVQYIGYVSSKASNGFREGESGEEKALSFKVGETEPPLQSVIVAARAPFFSLGRWKLETPGVNPASSLTGLGTPARASATLFYFTGTIQLHLIGKLSSSQLGNQ